jgi:Mg2+ and Co2+ transporter CorA
VTSAWLDLVDPGADELIALLPELDPEALELLAAGGGDGRDARPLLESHGAYVLGVLLFPVHDDDTNSFHYREVACVVTPDRLLTVRKADPRGEIASINLAVASGPTAAPGGQLLHELVDDLAENYLDLVDALYSEIDELEDHVDELSNQATRQRLSELRHEMLHARKNVSATRAAVRRVVDGRLDIGDDDALFPRDIEKSFADTYDTLIRTIEELDVARDLLASVRDYLQAKVSESQNEVVKVLTVVASLVLVPTLITGFYGQNFASAFDDPLWNLATSVGLIVVTTVAQLVVFRWRKWI